MLKQILYGTLIAGFIAVSASFVAAPALAGSKDLEAGKREKFQEDSVESMRDVFMRQEEESKQYRQKMLENSEKAIELMKEIKKLLQQLNEKE